MNTDDKILTAKQEVAAVVAEVIANLKRMAEAQEQFAAAALELVNELKRRNDADLGPR